MERGNFLSGLMAAPLALKARVLSLLQKRSVEPCGALIFEGHVIGTAHYRVSEQEKRFRAEFDPLSLLAAGQSLERSCGRVEEKLQA